MKHIQFLPILLLSALALFSCQDEADPLPDYVEDLSCLTTDYAGRAIWLCLDNGVKLKVQNEVKGLKHDTTYRVMALFTQQPEAGTAWLTDYAPILAPQAVKYKHPQTDPLNVVACWKSGDYVNFRLGIKGTYKGTHYFGFHIDSISASAQHTHRAYLRLVHNQNNDPLYYTREAYLSLPLQPFGLPENGSPDSVCISVSTFDGTRHYAFALNKQ